jgi:RsiW-degrading membrane proteinase PrsW (M82 family)
MTETPVSADGGSGGTTDIVTCRHCGAHVPAGVFCGNCGEHLEGNAGRGRSSSYAAAPNEHVSRTSVITTLFPHLPHRQVHVFREVLVVGVGMVLLLAALRLVAPATLVSVLLLPVLYLLYLYESEVYEDEPIQVLLLTVVAGGILGFVYFMIANHLTTTQLSGTVHGPLVTGVLLPLIAQVLMLAGPLVLLTRTKFDETLDGLTFAVASALGFTLVAGIASAWPFFTAPLVHGIAADDVLRILRSGVVASVVNAGTTGVIAAALWRRAPGHAGRAGWVTPIGVIAGFAIQVVLGVGGYYTPDALSLLLIWTVIGAVLLVVVRLVVHAALLEEAGKHSIGPLAPCGECHRLVQTMAFCPNCGAARLAAPKHARHAVAEEIAS